MNCILPQKEDGFKANETPHGNAGMELILIYFHCARKPTCYAGRTTLTLLAICCRQKINNCNHMTAKSRERDVLRILKPAP